MRGKREKNAGGGECWTQCVRGAVLHANLPESFWKEWHGVGEELGGRETEE